MLTPPKKAMCENYKINPRELTKAAQEKGGEDEDEEKAAADFWSITKADPLLWVNKMSCPFHGELKS